MAFGGHLKINWIKYWIKKGKACQTSEKKPGQGGKSMKKIVIVNSSPTRGGNCDLLCMQFSKGAATTPENEITLIDLKDQQFDFLREDQVEDDADKAARALIDSNVIVLATPVYFYNMSGMLKAFIDRMTPYFSQISGKDFYFILTAAINRSEMESTVESLYGFTDSLPDSNVVRTIYGFNVSRKGDVLAHPAYQEVFDIASQIF